MKAENNGEINVFLCQNSSPDKALSLPNDSWLTVSKPQIASIVQQQQQSLYREHQTPSFSQNSLMENRVLAGSLLAVEKKQRYGKFFLRLLEFMVNILF